MEIVDSHAHLLDEPGYLDSLLSTMDKCGIAKCCMSGLGELFGHADNTKVGLAFRAHPDRIIGAVFIRPGVDGPEKVDQAYGEGFRMVKAHLPRVPYDDASCFDLWAKANEYRMPVLFHTGMVVCKDSPGELISSWYMHPMRLEPITREFPDLDIIIAHLGVHWNVDAAELARMRPNVYVDLTGEPDGWRVRADTVGMDKWLWWPEAFEKVVFGTDVHYSKIGQILEEDVDRLERLNIPTQTRWKIFADNILGLLGMERDSPNDKDCV
jgi:predicted TIM-barrel fold metal-dependent hydrolase